MSDTTLTEQQVDDLVEFCQAAILVANCGMKQMAISTDGKTITNSGDAFKRAAARAFPHLGLKLGEVEPKSKKRRKKA